MTNKITKPSLSVFKGIKTVRVIFILHSIFLIGLLWVLDYMKLGASIWWTVVIANYLLLFLGLLIDHHYKVITLNNNALSYKAIFKEITIKLGDIEHFKYKDTKLLSRLTSRYDNSHPILFLVTCLTGGMILLILIFHSEWIQVTLKQSLGGKKKIRLFYSHEVLAWLREHSQKL